MAGDAGLLATVGVVVVVVLSTIHEVEEGYIGVYWRGGALLNSYTGPGYHLKFPFITTYNQVQVSLQTDEVMNIPCGTSSGVMLNFEKIEVVNRLSAEQALETVRKYGIHYDKIWIFDKIHHEINQFCSSHTLREVAIELFETLDESLTSKIQADCDKYETGIQIISARVTKPTFPRQIVENYISMEENKAKLLVATKRKDVVAKQAETDQLKAEIEARQVADVSAIQMEISLVEQKAQQEIDVIKDEIHLAKEKTLSDADTYMKKKVAEANRLRYSPQYVEYETYLALRDASKVHFEDSFAKILGFSASESAPKSVPRASTSTQTKS